MNNILAYTFIVHLSNLVQIMLLSKICRLGIRRETTFIVMVPPIVFLMLLPRVEKREGHIELVWSP